MRSFTLKCLSRGRLFSLALITTLGIVAPAVQADTKLAMGTGAKTGYYFSVGNLLCKSFVKAMSGNKCRARTTDGALENLAKLRRGKYDIVVVRSDWALNARDGSGFFENKKPDAALRSLFSTHSVPLTVIARTGSGITSLKDLNGKRVRLGGSASRLARKLPYAESWDISGFRTISFGEMDDQRKALCKGEIDAVASVVGYPSSLIQKTAQTCAIQLVELSGRDIDRLVSGSDALSEVTIPANTYKGVTSPTKTFGYKAILLSSANVPDDDVYAFVKSTFENLPQLTAGHPALKGLQPADMIRDGLPAPLHPGAARYYRERGWIN
ncbi:TAXI family TRAP transporter solute-binding subunit [Ruegeria faecimaris]|uniref:TAXI family TRAP transporter solute-binding subunit n=1 Tax=Ruegeria faecimaris TaxID=686389 RepID=UPI00232E0988|nr:TAXI family TRAP transporter solute-binding subunit [Ruegeria faecimaris]